MEQNQNALAVESDGDSAHGSLAVTAPSAASAPAPVAEYDSRTGTFITRAAAPARPPEPLVFARVRLDGWTPDRQCRFLEELADCGIVKEAAARVGMSAKSAWQLRRRAEGTAFGLAFETALEDGRRRLHSVALERAVEGVARPIFYRGEKVGEERIYDNRLLLALLARTPTPCEPRAEEVRRNWDAWLDAVELGLDEPPFDLGRAMADDGHVWLDEDGAWRTDLPPPEGQAVTEEGEWGTGEYARSLTAAELAVVEAAEAEERERAECSRDAFFRREKRFLEGGG